MKTYDVTVSTVYTFEVEAENETEAQAEAIAQAEMHSANFYDWQIDDVEYYE